MPTNPLPIPYRPSSHAWTLAAQAPTCSVFELVVIMVGVLIAGAVEALHSPAFEAVMDQEFNFQEFNFMMYLAHVASRGIGAATPGAAAGDPATVSVARIGRLDTAAQRRRITSA